MRFRWIIATVAWLVFMTCLSHQKGTQTARASRTLARGVQPLLPGKDLELVDLLLRKAAHLVLFAVLAVLASGALTEAGGTLPSPGLYGALLLWCWLDEATKPLVPGRHFSWLDVGLNGVGILLGAAVWHLVVS